MFIVMSIFNLSLFMSVMGIMSFIFNYSHLLNSLLSLEMISVSIYFMLGLMFFYLGLELFYLMYFLVMIVCEGALGLSILIATTYMFSEDYFKSINSLLC